MTTRSQRGNWTSISMSVALLIAAGAFIAEAAAQSASVPEGGRSVLDGVFKLTQAERGEQTFKKVCSACHIVNDVTGDKFRQRWADQTVGDVFYFLANTMPQADPGSLKPEEYTDVLAFFLRRSGYPAGDQDLPAEKDALLKVRIEPLPK